MKKQLAVAGIASFALGGALLAAPAALAAERAAHGANVSVAAGAAEAGLHKGGGCHKRKCKCKCKKHHKHYGHHKHYHEHYHKHHHDHGHHHKHDHGHGHHHDHGHGHHHKKDDYYDDKGHHDDHYYDYERNTSGDVVAPVVGVRN